LSLEFEWARRLRLSVMRRAKRVAPSRGRQLALGVGSVAVMVAATVFLAIRGIPGF
jgi:hypothetical protein